MFTLSFHGLSYAKTSFPGQLFNPLLYKANRSLHSQGHIYFQQQQKQKQKTNLEFHMKIKSQANSKMGLSGEGNPLLI